ncbi:MAG: FtsX-like permease family protein [Pseudomonadales bacterium]|nr:FtsX-like permease family protein [Pseudomonadales bacterium]MDG1442288.1 FtsX-like permease family protein [Pseudomonadales bacterium]
MKLGLALKLLWRDWRSGELTLLLVSLLIAVGTVTTITLFVDRLQQALLAESATFLAADRVISSNQPIDPQILIEARSRGLGQAETLTFLSMVFSSERAQFAAVKAVSNTYPLRGELITSDKPFEFGEIVTSGPPPGEIWLESRLLPSLDVRPGDVLDLGVASFVVSKALIKEPDKGGGFSNTGPRVLMNLRDVPSTEVVQPGSRLTYRYLFSGNKEALDDFQAWAKPRLEDNVRMFGVKEGTEGIGNALDRAERFLLLGGLLGVILAGVAIALSAQRYSLRHYDHVAILKTLGATPNGIDSLFITIFVLLGLFGTMLGSGVGYVAQIGISAALQPFIPVELPAPGMRPIWLGLTTGFVCLLSFALPPLLQLRSTEPIRVIRRDIDVSSGTNRLAQLIGVIGTIGLMWWYSEDLELTLMIFSGGVVALVVLSGIAFLLLKSGRVLGMQAGSVWRLALAGMQRRGQENTLQILVFGLAIMLLLILFLVRTALIADWQAQIPVDAPNHFAMNISPEDVEPINKLLVDNGIRSQPLYPMISGRISKVNGEVAKEREEREEREVQTDDDEDRGPRATSNRNLTYAGEIPDDNDITSGQWWAADYAGPALVSLEQDLAVRNGLKVGDALEFTIQGRQLDAEVASIRSVAWDNMQPNFYIIFSPAALEDFPSTFMTSFHLERQNKIFLNGLLREFPTMTVIEVDAIIEQIKTIIAQVTMAIELVLALILISGALVLLASIQASMDERFKQHAILRTLGAGRRLVMGSLVIEFCVLGLFAGVLAAIGAEITVYGLEEQIFQLDYEPNPMLWLLGPVIGAVLIGLIGTIATLKVVRTPPTIVLRGLN